MKYRLKSLAVGAGVLCMSIRMSAQPVACLEDSQCSTGYYCEESAHFCRECLSCDDLKRESLLPRDACVKSVVECGACYKGLVEDLRLDRACIAGSGDADADSVLPWYAWTFIALLLLGFCAMVFYVVCKKDTLFSYIFKIRTSTSVHNRCQTNGTGPPPSAPEPPPPYNALYERPSSPDEIAQASAPATIILEEDVSRPFIKREPSGRVEGPREAAARQAARPFNNPAYVRAPSTSFIQNDESETSSPFQPLDEDTMESLWTPTEPTNNFSLAETTTDGGAVARRPAAPAGPPAKTVCLREDTNNNPPGSTTGAAAAVVINVVTNINNLEQRNNLNQPRH